MSEPVTLPLNCPLCGKAVELEYQPGPEPAESVYFCPHCHKVVRLRTGEIPGRIATVRTRYDGPARQ